MLMNHALQFAILSFLLMTVACFIAFDILSHGDGAEQNVLPGARAASVFSMAVGAWGTQILGLLSVGMPSSLSLEMFPLLSALGVLLSLIGAGVVVRTAHGARRNLVVMRFRRVSGLLPFVIGAPISDMLIQQASLIDFRAYANWSQYVISYGIFLVGILAASTLVDKGLTVRDRTVGTVLRIAGAACVGLGAVLGHGYFYQNVRLPSFLAPAYSSQAIAATGVVFIVSGAILAVITVWMLLSLLQGRLDARIRETSVELQKMSDTDSLTGLPNRRCFHNTLERLIAENPEAQLAMFFLDLDGFKPINDRYGHSVGDSVLKLVATRLRCAEGKAALVARLGGDEFVVLFTGTLTRKLLDQYASAIIDCVAQPVIVEDHELRVTTSLGIAMYPEDAEAARLTACADAAMYRAKRSGKNQHRFFSPARDAGSTEMVELKRQLREGLDRGDFELRLCPQYNTLDGEMSGVEALVYWNHPSRGWLAHDAFFDDAQRFGLAQRIVKWLLQEVAKVQQALAEIGCSIRVSINFGSLQLKQHQFIGLVRLAIAESGLQSRKLSMELREVLVPSNSATAECLVHTLRALGIEVSLDEFGKGSVGVAALRRLDVARVRIAADYVAEAAESRGHSNLLPSMVALIESLGIAAALRGVDTEAQFQAAHAASASELQGAFFSGPVKLEELVAAIVVERQVA